MGKISIISLLLVLFSFQFTTDKIELLHTIDLIPFTGEVFSGSRLGPLNDHGIAGAVGFFDYFGDYYDNWNNYGEYYVPDPDSESLFSCADVENKWEKFLLRGGKSQRSKLQYGDFSFIASDGLLGGHPKDLSGTLTGGKIFVDNVDYWYEISKYSLPKLLNFSDLIHHPKYWLSEKYCIKDYEMNTGFSTGNLSWFAGLGKNLNNLYNDNKLKIRQIYEYDIYGNNAGCLNNSAGFVFYVEGEDVFYTIISSDGNIPNGNGHYSATLIIDKG